MRRLSRLPDMIAIAISYYLAHSFISMPMVRPAERAFAAAMGLIAVMIAWRLLKNRGWIIKILGYPIMVTLFLLLQGAVADYIAVNF